MKSTSSVFTKIDGCRTRTPQSSGESEFRALGAGCADGLYVKAILDDLDSQDQSAMRRLGSKSTGTETKFVQAYTTRESEVPVRARSRQSERSRSVERCDRSELGRHWDETFAESQIRIPQDFDVIELRERDDVPNRHCTTMRWI